MIEVKVLVKESSLNSFEIKAEKCDMTDKVVFKL